MFLKWRKESSLLNTSEKSRKLGYPAHIMDVCTIFARAQAALFGQEFTLRNWGAAYALILFLLTTEPATPVLYVVKLPVETARV
jgi:hypothetical protein